MIVEYETLWIFFFDVPSSESDLITGDNFYVFWIQASIVRMLISEAVGLIGSSLYIWIGGRLPG